MYIVQDIVIVSTITFCNVNFCNSCCKFSLQNAIKLYMQAANIYHTNSFNNHIVSWCNVFYMHMVLFFRYTLCVESYNPDYMSLFACCKILQSVEPNEIRIDTSTNKILQIQFHPRNRIKIDPRQTPKLSVDYICVIIFCEMVWPACDALPDPTCLVRSTC